jgi:hypothetical protein
MAGVDICLKLRKTNTPTFLCLLKDGENYIRIYIGHKRLSVWCLTRFSTIFQLYQIYWWRKPEYPEKTTDMSVASHRQTLSHNVVSSTPHNEPGSNSRL